MKYILFILILLHVNIFAQELSFQEIRKYEKSLVLKEFKKLFKNRKNIHAKIRQTMKHARSKNLYKNHISFFQAKNSNYEQTHQLELSDVFFGKNILCEGDCNDDYTEVNDAATDGLEDPLDTGLSTPSPDDIGEEINNNIRNYVQNPWMKK